MMFFKMKLNPLTNKKVFKFARKGAGVSVFEYQTGHNIIHRIHQSVKGICDLRFRFFMVRSGVEFVHTWQAQFSYSKPRDSCLEIECFYKLYFIINFAVQLETYEQPILQQ